MLLVAWVPSWSGGGPLLPGRPLHGLSAAQMLPGGIAGLDRRCSMDRGLATDLPLCLGRTNVAECCVDRLWGGFDQEEVWGI